MLVAKDIKDALKALELHYFQLEKLDTCADSYRITAVSDVFVDMRTLQRHRYMNRLLAPWMDVIHALELKTMTIKEYNSHE